MKFKSLSILFIVSMLYTSCYTIEKPEKPSDLLTEDEMVTILLDMAIMSSAKGVNKKKIEENGIVPDAYIFEKHNIDSLRFDTSNNYYSYNIDTYNGIYEKVKDSLTALRDYYKGIEAETKKKKAKEDSIKKANKRKNDTLLKSKNKFGVQQLKKNKKLKK